MSRPIELCARVIGLAAAVFWPAVAWAQSAPPAPSISAAPAPWIGLLLIAALLVMLMAVSLMPSKRGHQD